MSDTVSSGAAARTQSDDRTLAFVVYAMHFVSPFVFGLTSLIGVVIAYVRKPDAEPLVRSHYRFQIRSFWIGFGLAMVAAIGLMTGVGLLFWKLLAAVLADMPTDGWSAVSQELDVSFPVAAFVSLIVAGCAWLATAAWMILSSVIGAVRLSSAQCIGRQDRL
jgi:uncharacterized membrane protein